MAFTPDVYDQIRGGAMLSARAVVPDLLEILMLPPAARVLDVGCGEGWWAREFAERGCSVLALDETVEERVERVGDGVVSFISADLSSSLSLIDHGFDLAVCLEVVEHVPDDVGRRLVSWLAARASAVAFSAAVPKQGGHGHVNERWPGYWAEMFAAKGLVACEEFRWLYWDDPRVEPWYSQNLLLYAKPEWFAARKLSFAREPRAVVHPRIFEHRAS